MDGPNDISRNVHRRLARIRPDVSPENIHWRQFSSLMKECVEEHERRQGNGRGINWSAKQFADASSSLQLGTGKVDGSSNDVHPFRSGARVQTREGYSYIYIYSYVRVFLGLPSWAWYVTATSFIISSLSILPRRVGRCRPWCRLC